MAIVSAGQGGDNSPETGDIGVAHPDQVYIDWLLAALDDAGQKARGKNKSGLADALGINPSAITRLLHGQRRIRPDEIQKAARYFGLAIPDLGQKSTDGAEKTLYQTVKTQLRLAPVLGEAAAGRWMEYEVGDLEGATVPYVPTRFVELEQTAYKIVGDSMNLAKILDGDYVICVPYFMARASLSDGDIVIVERRRAGLYERTCKQLETRPAEVALCSRSTNPKFSDPIIVPFDHHSDDGVEVEVVGLVVGRYSPI